MPRLTTIDIPDLSYLPLAINQIVSQVIDEIARIDYDGVLRAEVPTLERIHQQYFSRATGPDNRRWEPLQSSTAKRKGSSEILLDKQALLRSLAGSGLGAIRTVQNQELEFGTSVRYSVYHQEGAGYHLLSRRQQRQFFKATGLKRRRLSARQFRLATAAGIFRGAVRVARASIRVRKRRGQSRVRRVVVKEPQRRSRRLPQRPHVGLNSLGVREITNNIADGVILRLARRI
jgi:hypothetical protein